jgi:hypothetical protein
MNITDSLKAFQLEKKLLISDSEDKILTLHNLGDLVLTSGKLVACDAFIFDYINPFTISLPPGHYPVILTIAHIPNNHDQRVAYATLRLREETPVHWQMAVSADQDLNSLEVGEIFGYGVDTGTGCFMDYDVNQMLNNLTEIEPFINQLQADLQKTYIDTWDWANICLDKSTQANIIAFSSGWGDGLYATYFGYDADNNLVCVVTDFNV